MLDLHMLFNLQSLKYVGIRVFSDPLFSRIRAESNSRRFCGYTEKCESEKTHILAYFIQSLHEKCPNTEFFLVCVFLYSDWIQENTEQKTTVFGHFSRSDCSAYQWDLSDIIFLFICCPDGSSCVYETRISHKNIGTKYYLSLFAICCFNFCCYFL